MTLATIASDPSIWNAFLDLMNAPGDGGSMAAWIWLGLGLLFLIGELVIPGIYLLWIGFAGIALGLTLLTGIAMPFGAQALVFAGLCIGSVLIANRYFYDRRSIDEPELVNRRGANFIGRTSTVVEAISNGRGHVRVGDSRWLASGPDLAEGTAVKIVAIEGSLLIVEPLKSGEHAPDDQAMGAHTNHTVDHQQHKA